MLPTILKPGNGVSHSLLVIGGGLYCNSAACAIAEAASKANATVKSNLDFIGVPPFKSAALPQSSRGPGRGKPVRAVVQPRADFSLFNQIASLTIKSPSDIYQLR